MVLSAGLKFVKLSLLGNEAEIPNPNTIPVLLWIAWGYWLLRYYQLLNDLGDKKIATTIQKKIDSAIPKKVSFDKAPKNIREARVLRGKDAITSVKYDSLTIHQRSFCFYEGTVNGYHLIDKTGTSHVHQNAVIDLKINFNQLFLPRIKAYFYVILKTRLFTKYLFPFLVALSPIIYLMLW